MAKHFKGWRKHTEPTLDLNGGTGGINHTIIWDEGDGATALCPSAVTTGGTFNAISSLTMTLTGVADGGDEVLVVAGVSFPLNANKSDTGAVGGTTFAVAYTTATQTFVVTKNGGGLAWHGDWQSLLRGITYNNVASPNPTEGDRTFTLTATDGVLTSTAATQTTSVFATGGGGPLQFSLHLGGESADTTATFGNGDGTTYVLPLASISDGGGDPVTSITAVGTGFTANDEIVKIGNSLTEFSIGSDLTTTVVTGVTTWQVAYTAATKTFVLTKNGGGSAADSEWQLLLRSFAYVNDTDPLTPGYRYLSFTATDGVVTVGPSILTLDISMARFPTLPTIPSYTYSANGGTTHTPTNSTQLQTAFDDAVDGDTIVLTAGTTYSGNFVIDGHTSGQINVISSELASLPAAGVRVNPDHRDYMPTISSPTYANPAITIRKGVQGFHFVGIEITTAHANRSNPQYGVIRVGYQGAAAGDAGNIWFDRCYIHGTNTGNVRDGVQAYNVTGWGIVNSHVSDFATNGTEAHAVHVYSGLQTKLQNNYISGSHINVFVGDNPTLPRQPEDFYCADNYFHKPIHWHSNDANYDGVGIQVKNLFEIKACDRSLIERNTFVNCWLNAQQGNVFVITPRGGRINDCTIRYNVAYNFEEYGNLNSADVTIDRLRIHDNVMSCYNATTGIGMNQGWRIAGGVNTYRDLQLRSNTHVTPSASTFIIFEGSSSVPDQVTRIDVRDNIATHGSYGIFGNLYGVGKVSAAFYTANYWFRNNALVAAGAYGNASYYPNESDFGNWFFPANNAAVGFTSETFDNVADFALAGGSPYLTSASDGGPLGADISLAPTELGEDYTVFIQLGGPNVPNVTPTWIEGDPVETLAASAIILHTLLTGVDSVLITFSGILDGADEILAVAGTNITLTGSGNTTGTAGGTGVDIAKSGGVITVTKTGGGVIPTADAQTLLRTLTYDNNLLHCTSGTRTFKIQATLNSYTSWYAKATLAVTGT